MHVYVYVYVRPAPRVAKGLSAAVVRRTGLAWLGLLFCLFILVRAGFSAP